MSDTKQRKETGMGDSTEAVDQFAGIADETGVPSKYLSIFIDEAELSIDSLAETFLTHEGERGANATEDLMIVAHRIKGSAASVGLNRPAKLAHLMEDVLQELRDNDRSLSPETTDALLHCTDALRIYIEGLKHGDPVSTTFSQLAEELLAAHVSSPVAAEEPTAISGGSQDVSVPTGLTSKLTAEIAESSHEEGGAYAGVVVFRPQLPLVGLKACLVYEKLANLGDVFYCDPPADQLDHVEELAQLAFGVATVLDEERINAQLRVAGVDDVQLSVLAPAQRGEQQSSSEASPTAPPQTSSQQNETGSNTEQPVAKTPMRRASDHQRPAETLRVDIDRLDYLMNLAGQLVINKARFTRIGDSMRQLLDQKCVTRNFENTLSALTKLSDDTNGSPRGGAEKQLEQMRGHVRRLAVEVEQVLSAATQLSHARGHVGELLESVHQLDLVSDGIQKSVMDTRMVPIGPLFTRFRRVIRDITRSSGKEMKLEIRGEKTELDKRMIDELGDPLIHMVRNSADHGIESPEDRVAAGKPRQGTVTLEAYHRGNSIVIEVRDDGAGLDLERIRQKAVTKNLVSEADSHKLTAKQLCEMIWDPGFSTATVVTEISGRGMGMDIVRTKIESINGTVELDTTPGEGSTFSIKLPLTLAILPSLMSEIDGEVFALPLESVLEIVAVDRSDLATVHGMLTATIRGRVVSVVELDDIFQWSRSSEYGSTKLESNEITLVVIGDGKREIALAVHSVLGEEDLVIKSLAENYHNVIGVAGASILGDGRVALILDVPTLTEMSTQLDKAPAAQ
jgi:two-component system chemotaxis sensor kinase CheA